MSLKARPLLSTPRAASQSVEGSVDTSPLRFLLEKSGSQLNRITAVKPLDDVIRETVEHAVAACDGSIPRAAAALDVSPSTLYRRIEIWRTDVAA